MKAVVMVPRSIFLFSQQVCQHRLMINTLGNQSHYRRYSDDVMHIYVYYYKCVCHFEWQEKTYDDVASIPDYGEMLVYSWLWEPLAHEDCPQLLSISSMWVAAMKREGWETTEHLWLCFISGSKNNDPRVTSVGHRSNERRDTTA